jgi:hypothetical protein
MLPLGFAARSLKDRGKMRPGKWGAAIVEGRATAIEMQKLVVEDVAKIALVGRHSWTNLMVVRICS